jgi:hypothetical protein
MSLKAAIRAELRKISTWANATLILMLPWADTIVATISSDLPMLQPYLPENAYKFMGGAVVVVNMLRSVWASHKAAAK